MQPITELVLVRHGESEGNTAREDAERLQADVIDVDRRDADVPLSELGRRQAAALAPVLGGESFDAVWSSPYVRARETAALGLPGSRPRIDERLRDRELGILDRLTARGVANRFPDEADRRRWLGKLYYRPPGGEAWTDVVLRLRSWLRDLPPEPGRLLVICHDAVILLMRYILEEFDEAALMELASTTSLGNASITRLVRTGERWHAADFDNRDHLGDLSTDHPAERPHAHSS